MVQREKASLWRMKQLLTKFRGDEIWAPCGRLQSEDDITLFGPIRTGDTEEFVGVHEDDLERPLPLGRSQVEIHAINDGDLDFQGSNQGERTSNAMLNHGNGTKDLETEAIKGNLLISDGNIATGNTARDDTMGGNSNADRNVHEDRNGHKTNPEVAESDDTVSNPPKQILDVKLPMLEAGREIRSSSDRNTATPAPPTMEMDDQNLLSAPVTNKSGGDGDGAAGKSPEAAAPKVEDGRRAEGRDREEDGENLQLAPHRMTTRAQAQAASDNTTSARTRSPSPASSTSTFVHPFFLVPPSAHPDRDFGLPPAEAEDTRRVLMSYVQKQEEVCRGVEKLYEGLLRADRMRKTVLKWCKAEAHVGEMSDGEDWYDKEEWALDEDLKKGHEEEEDEGGNQGKKTRGRRA